MRLWVLICAMIIVTTSSYANEFWQKMNLPDRGTVVDICQKDGLWLAASAGVFYTNDIEGDWSESYLMNFDDIEIDMPINEIIIYDIEIVTHDLWFGRGSEGLFLYTDNHGEYWQMLDIGIQTRNIEFSSDGVMYFSASDGYYVSYDTCKTLVEIEEIEKKEEYSNYDLRIAGDNSIFLPCGVNVHIKRHGEETFSSSTYTGQDPYIRFVDAYDTESNIIVFSESNGIYSLDEDNKSIEYFADYPVEPEDMNLEASLATPDGKLFVSCYDFLLSVSVDNGETWTDISDKIEGRRIYSMKYIDGKIYVCAEGIFVSEDGGETWTKKNKGIEGGSLYYGIAGPDETAYMIYYNELYRHSPGDEEAVLLNTEILGDDIMISDNFFNSDQEGNLYYYNILAEDGDKLLKSTDKGDSWIDFSDNIADKYLLSISKTGDIYAKSDMLSDNLERSSDYGQTWTTLDMPEHSVLLMCYANRYGEIIAEYMDGYCISTDRGETWTDFASGPLDEDGDSIRDFIVIADTIYLAIGYDGLYYTTDYGETWELNDSEVEAQFGSDVPHMDKLIKADGKIICDHNGVISMMPGDTEWTDENHGMNFGEVSWFDMSPDGYIYLINLRGMYRSTTPIISVDDEGRFSGKHFSGQVYPNPATDKCHVEISDFWADKITVSIYELSGKQVLAPCAYFAGGGDIEINTSELPAGQYFMSLSDGERNESLIVNVK